MKHNAVEMVIRKVMAIMIITLQTLTVNRPWEASFNNMRRDRFSGFPILKEECARTQLPDFTAVMYRTDTHYHQY